MRDGSGEPGMEEQRSSGVEAQGVWSRRLEELRRLGVR